MGDEYLFTASDRCYIAPRTVHGGWVIAEHREYRDADGVQVDYEDITPRIVYESEQACKKAIEEMLK